jgi:hypothetical protein
LNSRALKRPKRAGEWTPKKKLEKAKLCKGKGIYHLKTDKYALANKQ